MVEGQAFWFQMLLYIYIYIYMCVYIRVFIIYISFYYQISDWENIGNYTCEFRFLVQNMWTNMTQIISVRGKHIYI